MEFGILDRINLLSILPTEGTVVTMRILKNLKESLGFTEQEINDFGIRSEDNKVYWNETGYKVEIEIGEKTFEIIKDALKRMDEAGRVTEQMLPLCEAFGVG